MTDIPVWYKQTEVGIIPNDWTPWNLWDVSKVLYWFLFTPEYYRPGGKYKVITIWNIWDGYFDDNDCNETDRLPYCFKQFQFINNWDILVSMTWACLWRVCRADKWWWVMNYRVGKMIWNEKVSNDYLYQLLRQKAFWNEMLWIWKWWAQPNISRNDILNFKIALPPTIEEQQAIATTLSDMDDLISSLDELIEKKKNIRKWAMQKLLSPKENREHKKLWDICNFIKWRWLSKDKIVDNWENECLLYWELFTTYSYIIEKIESRTNSLEGNPSKEWDVLIPGSTTTVWIDLAKASAILKEWVLLGWDINILRRKNKSEYNSAFLAYYLTEQQKYNIAMQAQWITIIHLYWRNLEDIDVYMPKDIEEQNSIVAILSDMDKEIEALEEKKAKYEQIKQWTMQQLLTGKIRLV